MLFYKRQIESGTCGEKSTDKSDGHAANVNPEFLSLSDESDDGDDDDDDTSNEGDDNAELEPSSQLTEEEPVMECSSSSENEAESETNSGADELGKRFV